MPFLTAKLGRLSLLLALLVTLVAAFPTTNSVAQQGVTECSDGLDNDGDNAIDGADFGCPNGDDDSEAITEYTLPGRTIPLPVVTIQGTVSAKGVVKVSTFQIRAIRGSNVNIRCKGKGCPFKSADRTMISSKLRLKQFQTKLKPNLTIKLRIGLPDDLGKYLSYKVRKKKAPVRNDQCIAASSGNIVPCFNR